MTSTMEAERILKVDRLGRVQTPRERREALLEEFDRSGMSGQRFAKWAGIRYGTFITWVQKRSKATGPTTGDKPALSGMKSPLQWVEALVEKATSPSQGSAVVNSVMIVQGPGGLRLELSAERHVLWAAKLLRQLEVPGRC